MLNPELKRSGLKERTGSSSSRMAGSYEIYLLRNGEPESDGPKLEEHVV